MMIARFRVIGWVAGCASAALCCYLASQQVAAERLALARVDRAITDMRSDNARLATEIATRSRMGQIERWNVAFRLGAPSPRQYMGSEMQLAAYVHGRAAPLDRAIEAAKSPVTTVAYTPAAPVVAAPTPAPVSAVAEPAPRPKLQTVAHVAPVASEPALLHAASFVRPASTRLAPADPLPLAKVSLGTDRGAHAVAPRDDLRPRRDRTHADKVGDGKPTSLLPAGFTAETKPAPKRLAALLTDDLASLAAAETRGAPARSKR